MSDNQTSNVRHPKDTSDMTDKGKRFESARAEFIAILDEACTPERASAIEKIKQSITKK